MRDEDLVVRLSVPADLPPVAAARRRGLEPLELRCQRSGGPRASLPHLASHLLDTHHPHLEERLRRVERAIVMVAAMHGLATGRTWDVARIFVDLTARLRAVLEGERRLFGSLLADVPHGDVRRAEDGPAFDAPWPSDDRLDDHEQVGRMLERMSSLTAADGDDSDERAASPAYRAMLAEIAALQDDYHAHWSEQQAHLGWLDPA
ncbi:MAG: hypothetical protein J5I93_24960 [Pirellulaceae bacterium]|nr:hypothetical protein [Pirellulaceae bacterium]